MSLYYEPDFSGKVSQAINSKFITWAGRLARWSRLLANMINMIVHTPMDEISSVLFDGSWTPLDGLEVWSGSHISSNITLAT